MRNKTQALSQAYEDRIQAKLLSPNSTAWVRRALDTFPDTPIKNFLGVPGEDQTPNVIYHVKQSTTIINPAGSTSLATWDCNMFLSNVAYQTNTSPSITASPTYTCAGRYLPVPAIISLPVIAPATAFPGGSFLQATLSTAGPRLDGLVISSAPSGFATFTGNSGTINQNLNLDGYLSALADDGLVNIRIAYMGYEVINSTPVIYQGGTVTTYESASTGATRYISHIIPGLVTTTPLVYRSDAICRMYRMPPVTLAQAQQTPNSQSWEAAQGSYVSAKFTAMPTYDDISNDDYIFTSDAAGYAASSPTSYLSAYAGSQQLNAGAANAALPNHGAALHTKHNQPGTYFTGLPGQTVLTVVWHIGYELVPAASDVANQALTRMPANYDLMAFEFYTVVANSLPIGVPRDFNDLGEWFRMVSVAMAKALPTVFHFLPILGGAMSAAGMGPLGAAVGAIGTAGSAIMNASKPRQVPQVQQQPKPKNPEVAKQVISKAVAAKKAKEYVMVAK